MISFKTTAHVEDTQHLKLRHPVPTLEQGMQVELLIFIKSAHKPKNWQSLLKSLGTYDETTLAAFSESRKDLDQWTPPEF
jgi:hypothetical protein